MSEQQKSHIFSAWLDGAMSTEQRKEFEQFCLEDSEFAARVEKANHVSQIASSQEDFALPTWDKASTFDAPAPTPWWQWQGLSALSMACSAFAIVLVVSGFNIQIEQGRLSAGFGQQVSEQEIAQLVETKMDQYQTSSQAMFAQYVDAMQTQQRESSAQLTEYLLSSSRQERREDFAELITFINQQRSDDQVFFARQLNNLQQEIDVSNQRITPIIPN